MSFATPKVDTGLDSNTPGRSDTQTPEQVLPLLLGRGRVAVQWVTPVLHWNFRTFKLGQDAWASGFGWLCCGPIDEIETIILNDKPYNGIYKAREDFPGDYIEHVMSFGDISTTFRIWWGLENAANYSAYLQSLVGPDCPSMLGKTHPDYAGVCAIAVTNLYGGSTSNGESPPLPKLEMELYRRSPSAYSFGYVAHGTHPVGIVKDILTLPRGGRGLPASYFDDDKWTATMQRLMDSGLASMRGTDLFLSFVFAEAKEADEQCADVMSYLDAWLLERNGQLEIGWSPADGSIDEAALRVITEHELAGDDVDEDPGDLDGIPSQVKVTGLDWVAAIPLSQATEAAPVPFVNRITSDPRAPESVDRPGFTTRWQLKSFATIYAAARATPDATFTVPVLRQYAVQLDGVTPLRAGDLFVLNLAVNGGKRVVLRISERSADDSVKVTFKCARERGSFPEPAQPVLDPRVDTTVPPPADFARFTAAQLPPDLSDVDDTFVTVLIERPATSTMMWGLELSATDSWPGVELEAGSPRWAVGAVLQTTMAASFADATVTVDTVGEDWATLRSQSTFEQEDDRLLLYHAGEWHSVGTIAPLGGGSFSLALQRASLGSLPVAHAIGDVVFLVYRANIDFLTHATFSDLGGSSYDETTATKWFKARPLGAGGVQGNFTAAFSLVMRDPTPNPIEGLEAITGTGKIVDLRWEPVTTSLVNEYSVHRATGPGYTDEAQIGEAAQADHPRYIDIAVAIGTTYRYRMKAHTTDEEESDFSDPVEATPGVVDTYSPDLSPPAAPLAPVYVGGVTYLSDDGTRFCRASINLKALTAGTAIGQYLMYRLAGGGTSDPYTNKTPYFNTSDEVVPIDDLSPGVDYDIATENFNINGVPSAVVSGGTFTASTAASGPTPPSGATLVAGDNAAYRPPPVMHGATQAYALTVLFTDSASKDILFYQFALTSDSDAAANILADSAPMPNCTKGAQQMFLYSDVNTGPFLFLRIRAFGRSSNISTWLRVGDCAAYFKQPVGSMIEQNATAIAVTGGSLTGMTTIATTSSKRVKTNIRRIRHSLAILWKLRGVQFDRTDRELKGDIGLIAEEVDEFFPSVVTHDEAGNATGVDYGKLVGLCVAGINQLVALLIVGALLAAAAIAFIALHG